MDLTLEFLAACLALGVALQILLGSRRNAQLMKSFQQSVLNGYLNNIFSFTRHSPQSLTEMISYCSGRASVSHAIAKLALWPRQDAISTGWSWLNSYLRGAPSPKDCLELEAYPLRRNGTEPGGFVVAICHNSALQRLRQHRYDLHSFTRVQSLVDLNHSGADYRLLLDDAALNNDFALVKHLFQEQSPIKTVLTDLLETGSLQWLIISSAPRKEPQSLEDFDNKLKLDMSVKTDLVNKITTISGFDILKISWELLVLLTDHLTENNILSSDSKSKYLKQQRSAKDALIKILHKKEQEELKKQAEQKRLQKERERRDGLDRLPRDQRRKLEEKENRKKAAKSQRKLKMVKI